VAETATQSQPEAEVAELAPRLTLQAQLVALAVQQSSAQAATAVVRTLPAPNRAVQVEAQGLS
jgi:hypothetical protein